jgi:hypothetical protein
VNELSAFQNTRRINALVRRDPASQRQARGSGRRLIMGWRQWL